METVNQYHLHFLISGAIKNLARSLNNESENSPIQDLPDTESSPTCELYRARLLLLFLEHLEKAIYNAAEGCAIAMPLHLCRSIFAG
jgi:hypothetical protein